MVLGRFRSGARSRGKPPAAPTEPHRERHQGLPSLLQAGITLQGDRQAALKEGLDKGLEFFETFNESRLNLAFTSFDVDMKKALYEVLFLLHVNDPAFAELKFRAVRLEHKAGVVKEHPYEATADLYVEGAPHGVEGLERVSEVFRADFFAHIEAEYGMAVTPGSAYGWCPIVSVHSLGSIGTMGHKSRTSDLDLQVQYELEPFLWDTSDWSDQTLRDALLRELMYWVNRARVQMKLPPDALKNPEVKAGLRAKAQPMLAKTYPRLNRYLLAREGNYLEDLQGQGGTTLRTQLVHEMMTLMKRSTRLTKAEELKKREALIKERINRIQKFIMAKYPTAEIYLFSSSNDDYRKGHHGTTLESKEASGSAYELILNYETLMPGIQITPMVPTHFVVPQFVNDDGGLYERMMDYVRFGALEVFKPIQTRLTDLGATPDMPLAYVAKHSGAVYWEAFKASSGNLPKALLNLFRYEMLLDDRFRKTTIQNIKIPTYLNQFASPRPEDESADLEALTRHETGIPAWALLDMETKFPLLLQDPWWLRYKALKIGFGEPEGLPGLEPAERRRASRVIDLAFALHVRISDVFTKPGDTRTFETHREQVLLEFLRRAFPPISPGRTFLEHLFMGEVRTVNEFEAEMRDLFKRCLQRTNGKIAAAGVGGESNQKEFEIWYHYYQENFEPAPNVVQRTIMNHLKVPRGRLQIGYRLNEGWFFRSLQKESSVGKRFDTFGVLDHLPSDVVLREKSTFLAGLADCVLNGYYGIINEGTLKESRTAIEFDAKSMDLGNRIDNTLAFVRPDSVHRILDRLIEFFPYQPYHYMDCIRKKREITELYIFLNLLKFGRLSLLYRDNLRTWYCDEVDHPEMFSQVHRLRNSVRAMVTVKSLHVTLARFFKAKNIYLDRIALEIWINPNSVETTHSAAQTVQKERALAEEFKAVLFQVHHARVLGEPEQEAAEAGAAAEGTPPEPPPAAATDAPPAGAAPDEAVS